MKPGIDADQAYCVYCQKQYAKPMNLARHIRDKHPETYAIAVAEAIEAKHKKVKE